MFYKKLPLPEATSSFLTSSPYWGRAGAADPSLSNRLHFRTTPSFLAEAVKVGMTEV
jgi:hypothetical protein